MDIFNKSINMNTNWLTKIIIADRTQHLSNKYSLPIEEVQNLLQYDPTKGRYLEWITKNYKSKELRFPEDGSKTIETLTTFTKLQPVLKRNNVPIDINLYSYSDLVRLIEQYGEQKSKREQHRINEVDGVKELLNFPPYKAIEILTPEASAKLCRDTEWCIKDPKFFKNYSAGLIMVLKNGEPYYLIHEETEQYKNVYDRGLLNNETDNLEALEVLKKLYDSGIVKEPVNGDFGFEILDLLSEETIAKSPKLSFCYADYILGGRFELGEEAIATDPQYSYQYAESVIGGSFELGEPAIATNGRYSYYYAANVIGGRFELGEPAIAWDEQCSLDYARYIINGRFELGERSIAKDAFYSYSYALDVIKSRFGLGEPAISKIPHLSFNYALFVLKGRFELGETTIATSPEWAYRYARDIIKDRFELGEKSIYKNIHLWSQYIHMFNLQS